MKKKFLQFIFDREYPGREPGDEAGEKQLREAVRPERTTGVSPWSFIFAVSFIGFLSYLGHLGAGSVFAGTVCTTQYGGGQTCVSTGQLLVNKKVFDPAAKTFKDNLGLNDYKFSPGGEVTFMIEIKNVGDVALTNINLVDTLPSFLQWSGGEPLNSMIDSLAPGQSLTKAIKAKVLNNGATTVICQVNTITATSGANSDRDTAQLCAGQFPKEVPKSGPEALGLLALPALGGLGFWLKRRAF